jgi:ABC-type transporter Mla subunit MlaD
MLGSLVASLHSLWENTPTLILYGCGFLFLWTVVMTIDLLRSTGKLKARIRAFTLTFEQTGEDSSLERRNGLTLTRLDNIRVQCSQLQGPPAQWWHRVDEKIESYTSPEEVEGWFLTEAPRSALPQEIVIGRNFNSARFGAFPGILTGVGLMLTFVAILLALLGVHYDKSNSVEPISGIDILINGLSGKFLSSICALSLSILFTLGEREVVRRLKERYEDMLLKISRTIPHLSNTRILLDIQRFSAKQTVSVSNISSEVVDRLTNAFNDRVVPGLATGMSDGVAEKLQTEFRPTLERMTATLDGLQQTISGLEQQKQESVTGEFEKMAHALEQSITNALASMATQFHEALSGSAQKEFGNVQNTLESTRGMLASMNDQFSKMQAAFAQIIAKAEAATTDQLNSGRQQTEALTALMHGLMNKLQETADHNISTMQAQLTNVVGDLTQKVTQLSIDMMDAAKDMAGTSQESAKTVIDKTDAWTATTASRLEALFSNMEDRSRDFKEAGEALLNAKSFMSNLLNQNANALAQMAEASRTVQSYSNGLAGQSDALKAIASHYSDVSGQLKETSGNMKSMLEQNRTMLEDYRKAVGEYRSVLDSLDVNIAKIMEATTRGLSDYNQSVEKNFTKICDIANDMVPKAANLLNTQITDLGEQLDELGDVISKAVGGLNGRAH